MSRRLADALSALERYGQAHARVRHVQSAASLHLKEIQSDFVATFEEVVLPHLDGYDEMSEEAIEDWLDEYEEVVLGLLGSEGSLEELPDELVEHVDEAVGPFLDELRSQRRKLDEAERLLVAPHREAVYEFQQWLDEVRRGGEATAEDGWPHLIAAWREAVDVTKLEAARVLGVSQSTIVRYENRTRCPSIPLMTELLGRIAEMPNPLTGEALRIWESLRSIADMFEQTPDSVVATMGSAEVEEQLRTEIEDDLDRIDLEGLRLLRAVASDAALRRKLIEWAENFRLDVRGQSVAKEISRATRPPSPEESERK